MIRRLIVLYMMLQFSDAMMVSPRGNSPIMPLLATSMGTGTECTIPNSGNMKIQRLFSSSLDLCVQNIFGYSQKTCHNLNQVMSSYSSHPNQSSKHVITKPTLFISSASSTTSTILYAQKKGRRNNENTKNPSITNANSSFRKSRHSSKQAYHPNQHLPQKKKESRTTSTSRTTESTVVILYHKPKGVITSHSSNDQVSSRSNGSSPVQSRFITVYDDIMSMKGYYQHHPKNSSHSNNTTKSSPFMVPPHHSCNSSIAAINDEFYQVTGISKDTKLHAIGRLDADTTGLLLVTNDGALVHHVTNPTASTTQASGTFNSPNHVQFSSQKIVKVYHALIMGYHTLEDDDDDRDTSQRLKQLLQGVDIGAKYGGMTSPPHELTVLSHPTPKSTWVRIAIAEGKNRQIRRMFHAIQSGVMKLHRVQVGNLSLDMLSEHASLSSDHHGASIQSTASASGMMDSNNESNVQYPNPEEEGRWRLLSDEEIRSGLGWDVRKWDSQKFKGADDVSHSSRSSSAPHRRRRSSKSRRTHRRKDLKQ